MLKDNILASILESQVNHESVISAKLLASDLFRLDFLPNTHLPDNLIEVLELINVDIANRCYDECKIKIKQAEDIYLRYYLGVLSLSEEFVNELISYQHYNISLRLVRIFTKAIMKKYFQDNNFINWRQVYEALLDFLSLYGFRETYYIQRILMEKINIESENVEGIRARVQAGYPALTQFLDPIIALDTILISSKKIFKVLSHGPIQGNPLLITMEIMRFFNPQEINPIPLINRLLYQIFYSIGTMRHHMMINSLCYYFEHNVRNLRISEPCSYNLSMKILIPRRLGPSRFILPENNYIITSNGLEQSSRFCSDRITLFGKFKDDNFTNDIFIDPSFEKFSNNHFMIVSADNGYFICDMSASGKVAKKLNESEEVEIQVGMIIGLGYYYLMRVEEIIEFEDLHVVNFRILNKYNYETKVIAPVKNNGEPFVIGRNGVMIDEKPQNFYGQPNVYLVSKEHCNLLCKGGKVFIQDIIKIVEGKPQAKTGTYVLLQNYKQFIENAPSEFYPIKNLDIFYSNELEFRFQFAPN